MKKLVYIISSKNGKRKDEEIVEDLKKADVIVFKGGERNKEIARQEKLVIKMHRPIWYRPKPGFLA